MEKKRVFRQDYIPLNKKYNFKCGDVTTILKEDKPNIRIAVNEKPYLLPFRDFYIVTKYLM